MNEKNKFLLDRYRSYLKYKKSSENSIRNYSYEIISFLTFVNKDADKVTKQDVRNYLHEAYLKGNKESRRRFKRSVINSFYKYIICQRLIDGVSNPCEDVEIEKDALVKSTKRLLDKRQLAELLKQDDKLQDLAFITLLVNTMLPLEELKGLLWKDIRWKKNYIIIGKEKDDNRKVCFITDHTKDVLWRLKEERKNKNIKQKWVFITRYNNNWNNITVGSVNKLIKRIGNKVGISELKYMEIKQSTQYVLINDYGADIDRVHTITKENRFYNYEDVREAYFDKKNNSLNSINRRICFLYTFKVGEDNG